MRESLLVRSLLAGLLILTAAAKLVYLPRDESGLAPYWISSGLELAAAALLLLPRTARMAAMMTAFGIAGAGSVTLFEFLRDPATPHHCHCLGAPVLSQGGALLAQGVLLFLATVALRQLTAPRTVRPVGPPVPGASDATGGDSTRGRPVAPA